MIDIEKVTQQLPVFDTFCSVDKLHRLVEGLQTDKRFNIQVAGTSEAGIPIYHIQFGEGSVKALVVAGPHADEPIGSLTAFGLLTLLKNNNKELVGRDIQWHIIPCIDPDGAKLNEGWTQQPYSFKNFMRNFHKQYPTEQVDGSFPLSYKEIYFNQPTPEARALMDVLESVVPDFYYSLHNAFAGGCYFVLSDDLGLECYQALYRLLGKYNIGLNANSINDGFLQSYAESIYKLPSARVGYDFHEKSGKDFRDFKKGGDTSWGYFQEINPDMVTFVSELAYLNFPIETFRETNIYLRQLVLQADADNKFVKTVILEEWNKVKNDLDIANPFYKKVSAYILLAEKNLHECAPETPFMQYQNLLSDPKYSGKATGDKRFNLHMTVYWVLCHNYEFVRLLKASQQTAIIQSSINRLESLFDNLLEDIGKNINLSELEVIDVNTLAKVQLGSGLIALNAVLERKNTELRARNQGE